ncbi:hypothetical protein KDL44_11525 [bacterium]|nr:hypothetical protein [bacterium]
MDLVATRIKLSLSGMFGRSGRYYEFREPVELIAETEEHGAWIHRLDALGIWTVEPGRADSLAALLELLDAEFGDYGKPDLEFDQPAATEAYKRFQQVVKRVL